MTPSYKIQIRALYGIDELISELHGDAEPILNDYGYTVAQIYQGRQQMAMADFVSILEHCAKLFQCPNFGLRLGAKQDFRMLGPLGKLVQKCETPRDTVDLFRRYLFFHNQSEYWENHEFGNFLYLRRSEMFHDLTDTRQYKELAFSACMNIFSLTLGEGLQGARIELSHAPLSDPSVYRDRFHIPVRFNCEQDQWIIPKHYFDKPIRITDEDIEKVSSGAMHDLYNAREDLVYQVSSLIQKSMLFKNHSIDSVAEMLGVSTRTLQRQLSNHDIVFKDLVREIRTKTACWYLTSSNIDITALAEMLGYSDVSGFSRAFKKNMGVSPLQWRRRRDTDI